LKPLYYDVIVASSRVRSRCFGAQERPRPPQAGNFGLPRAKFTLRTIHWTVLRTLATMGKDGHGRNGERS